ncbi:MAG: gamma-glutamyltransferase family protein [Acidimicrobiales bacterium]
MRTDSPLRHATGGMVSTVDHLASSAGVGVLAAGGNAADAAVAASAALAVTTQHMCGMGGDLWALVHDGSGAPATLNSSGRAPSGASAAELRAEGHADMPFRGDARSATVPGCVDGWLALHERCGRLPLADVLAPAIRLARGGFPCGASLAASLERIAGTPGNDDYFPDGWPAVEGQRVRRPLVADALEAIAADGRDAWYQGPFGDGLLALAPGWFTPGDLDVSQAEWVDPLVADAWGHRLWTPPPNSQGYLSLAGALVADGLDLGDDPDDARWGHLLIETAKQVGHDRGAVLSDQADGAALLAADRLDPRRAAIDPERASGAGGLVGGGGTIHLCVVDGDGMGVSLIQSNAAGFGTNLAVPEVRVFLHNRGIGFSLAEGHPAELAPGRRPPSTLSPALVTRPDGRLRAVVGTMGGDGQPQVILQLVARLLQAGQDAGTAMAAPRFTLTAPGAHGFDTWADPDRLAVGLEFGSPWADGLAARGHRIDPRPWGESLFGHAHIIEVLDDGAGQVQAGAADPRAGISAALGL